MGGMVCLTLLLVEWKAKISRELGVFTQFGCIHPTLIVVLLITPLPIVVFLSTYLRNYGRSSIRPENGTTDQPFWDFARGCAARDESLRGSTAE